MIRVVRALFLLLAFAPAPEVSGQEPAAGDVREWATPGEQNGWFAPTSPAAMGEYLASMAEAFEAVALDTLGLGRMEGPWSRILRFRCYSLPCEL